MQAALGKGLALSKGITVAEVDPERAGSFAAC